MKKLVLLIIAMILLVSFASAAVFTDKQVIRKIDDKGKISAVFDIKVEKDIVTLSDQNDYIMAKGKEQDVVKEFDEAVAEGYIYEEIDSKANIKRTYNKNGKWVGGSSRLTGEGRPDNVVIASPPAPGSGAKVEPPPVKSAEADKESENIVKVPGTIGIPKADFETFYETKVVDGKITWVSKKGTAYDKDTNTWIAPDGTKTKYGDKGENKLVFSKDGKTASFYEANINDGVIGSYFQRGDSFNADIAKNVDLKGLIGIIRLSDTTIKVDGETFPVEGKGFDYKDRREIYSDDGLTHWILRDLDGVKGSDGQQQMDDIYSYTKTTQSVVDGKKVNLYQTEITFVDKDNNYGNGYNPSVGTSKIKTFSGVSINSDKNSGDVVITYIDKDGKAGSTDAFGGRSGTIKQNNDFSYTVSGEFLTGEQTISVNPITGDVFVEEKEDDDYIVYDKNGKEVASTPVLSGRKKYDGIYGTGTFFGVTSGDFISYESENGGISKIVTKPKTEYYTIKDTYGKDVSIPRGGTDKGGYTIDINYDVVETPNGQKYMLSDGRDGTVAGLYYQQLKDGTLVSIDKNQQSLIENNRHMTVHDGAKHYRAPLDKEGNLITHKESKLVDGKIVETDTGKIKVDIVDDDGKKTGELLLAKDDSRVKQLKNANKVHDKDTFWEGRSAAAQVGAVLSTIKSQSALTNALWGEDKVNEWKDTADQFFAKNYLGVEYWANDVCKDEFKTIGESAAIIETKDGLVQLVSHVEGEKTAKLPDEQRFYKITFRVTAPSDSSLTPQSDEDGAISFNVRFVSDEKVSYLFVNENTKKRKDIQLENGASYNAGGEDAILFYSSHNYNMVYIDFGKKILDRTSRYRDSISEVHNVIIESSGAIDNWFESIESDTPGTPGSTSSGNDADAPATIINPDL